MERLIIYSVYCLLYVFSIEVWHRDWEDRSIIYNIIRFAAIDVKWLSNCWAYHNVWSIYKQFIRNGAALNMRLLPYTEKYDKTYLFIFYTRCHGIWPHTRPCAITTDRITWFEHRQDHMIWSQTRPRDLATYIIIQSTWFDHHRHWHMIWP